MASVTAGHLAQQVQRATGSVGKLALNHADKFLGVLGGFGLAHERCSLALRQSHRQCRLGFEREAHIIGELITK